MTERCWEISGRVQGVGFRYWVIRQAYKIGDLSGYAMNHPSGNVMVKAVGKEDDLDKLFMVLHKGPLFSRVDSVVENPSLNTLFPPVAEGIFQRI
jgi:acylphosphatase